MTLVEFERLVFAAALRSPICDIPSVCRLISTSISLRVCIESGGFLVAFYSQQTDTTAFAFIRKGRRLYGADNTGGWQVHPFDDPSRHDPLAVPLSFAEFVEQMEQHQRTTSIESCSVAWLPQLFFSNRSSHTGMSEDAMSQSSVRLPKAELLERALARELGGTEKGEADVATAREIVRRATDRYNDLHAERKHYGNRALRQHLVEGILPGVALYQTLLDDPGTQQASLDLTEAALAEGVAARRRSMERLGRLPFFFGLMRVVIKPFMRLNFPAEGWEAEWVETSGDALAFNMHRCFYLDVLEGYGVPELTALYCKMDDLVYDGVSPHVKWDRKHTLGRGDECCDFRFERVKRRD